MQEKNSERLKMSPYQLFSHYIRDVDGAIKSQSRDTDLRSIRLSAAQVLKGPHGAENGFSRCTVLILTIFLIQNDTKVKFRVLHQDHHTHSSISKAARFLIGAYVKHIYSYYLQVLGLLPRQITYHSICIILLI